MILFTCTGHLMVPHIFMRLCHCFHSFFSVFFTLYSLYLQVCSFFCHHKLLSDLVFFFSCWWLFTPEFLIFSLLVFLTRWNTIIIPLFIEFPWVLWRYLQWMVWSLFCCLSLISRLLQMMFLLPVFLGMDYTFLFLCMSHKHCYWKLVISDNNL